MKLLEYFKRKNTRNKSSITGRDMIEKIKNDEKFDDYVHNFIHEALTNHDKSLKGLKKL